ncbi:MAG: shikimate kinase [Rhodocyclaceae bacterium]|jgi:shikimate kinase|uniref:Shikimate kinase n=1 Tax=Fluviibacter phosphoraccumulans TaxID=1751046 RepID=A0A679HXQ6_9RHOO|nr:shikimate kinase [Fluviibacter phosphoraccumulans]MBP7917915.1 shikimate kinase [Rhodocyclaceae bacterium]MBP7991222.1 shikimate kinase [Rhodocyclaceae bacterium]BBU68144.1 shikimate kinase [Fluviibacter phosphoraccumulans]BBU70316.1 shikimate kinase [Fluviibacter phosphoraccumulans]BCA66321.1 shikimate kinase [Fluviibacter phosphoraccumulans]
MTVAFPENIFLVGLMGAGKSTVGRILARRLSKRFVDTDHEIEKRNGVTIPVIFEIEGEEGFRRREQELLADLAQEQGLVLSTGGGIVLKSENREVLRNHGFVVYLNARPELLADRTKHDRSRPLLNVEDPLTRLRELHAVRDPLYREVAHAVVETGRGAPQQVVQAILAEISLIDR